jgi:hypothetical protein
MRLLSKFCRFIKRKGKTMSSVKYFYHLHKTQQIDISRLNEVFPNEFNATDEGDHYALEVSASDLETDENMWSRVDRECDRIFFLTGAQLNPKFVAQENADGSSRASSSTRAFIAGVQPIPSDLEKQNWGSPRLSLQLKLWFLAQQPNLPIAAKVILLFQVIEACFPNRSDENIYPIYVDESKAPENPMTEAKLLRNFVSHQGDPKVELSRYCRFLGFDGKFFDPSNAKMIAVVKEHIRVVEDKAREIIIDHISKR